MTDRRNRMDLVVFKRVDLLSLFFLIVAILLQFYLYGAYLGSKQFPKLSADSLQLIIKGIIGFGAMMFFGLYRKIRFMYDSEPVIGNSYKRDDENLYLMCIGAYIAIQMIGSVLQNAFKFQSVAADVYAFYNASAIIEEFFFRGMVIGIIMLVLSKLTSNETLIKIISIFSSAIIFALSHTRYYSNPIAMGVTLMGGITQAYFYIKTKNLFPCLLAHAIVNNIAAGSMVESLQSIYSVIPISFTSVVNDISVAVMSFVP